MEFSKLKSWVSGSNDSFFPIQNLPLGVFSTKENGMKRICSRIGDYVIDLSLLHEEKFLNIQSIQQSHLKNEFLNDLIRLGKNVSTELRNQLIELFSNEGNSGLTNLIKCLISIHECSLHLPIQIGDYTDFYSSREHATNVGIMFRDPANALMPNWLHLPVGYHGRASSIVVSGTEIQRPSGQIVIKDGEAPVYSKSRQLDFELEMAFVIGKENRMGDPIPIQNSIDHICGFMLFNDWSARDIQKWEYVPLGPFLGKNFASTISPWLVSLEALAEFKCNGPDQTPTPLSYLNPEAERNFDIQLEIFINDTKICTSNTKYLYWSISQQLAHHTVNGCNMRIGDLCASGTISGPESTSYGSMLELAWKGTKPIVLNDGTTRTFLQDGDRIKMIAFAQNDNYKIGFGSCEGRII
ncbi:MAG: fumarylacetoacetase [Saprospiraceae bacterium]|nr:fumarylacetoacetase [Saprospiraceae bacterium]